MDVATFIKTAVPHYQTTLPGRSPVLAYVISASREIIRCSILSFQACKDCFYKNVKSLAEYDALLASRLDLKRALVSKGKSENDFVKELTSTKSNGKAFSCGYTR